MARRWRIYYTDGTKYDSDMGPPRSAPAYGVGIVVQRLPDRSCNLLRYETFYYWSRDRWYGGDEYAPFEMLRERRPFTAVRSGRMMPDEGFYALYRAATNDPDFPNPRG